MSQIFRAVLIAGCMACVFGCGPSNPPEEPEYLNPATGGGGGTETDALSFMGDVMPILKAKCTGCHAGQYEQPATTYMRLSAKTAANAMCASTPRIVVNDGANSLLVKKLLGTAGCGAVMPLVKVSATETMACAGTDCVASADIEKVKRWIDQGALNN